MTNGNMLAAVVIKPGDLQIVDLPIPEPGPYEALCKLKFGATCTATDTHIIEGTIAFAIPYPAVLGHESVGEVLETGAKVQNLRPGDLVTRVGTIPCPDKGIDIAWGGYAQYGIARDHWAMERDGLDVPAGYRVNQVVHHSIPAKEAAMFTTWRETLSFITRMGVTAGMKALIIGSGGNGLAYANHAFNAGANVCMVGSASRRNAASQVGVQSYCDYEEDCTAQLREFAPSGLDMIVDAVGKRDSLDKVMSLIKDGAQVGIYGIDDLKTLAVNPVNPGKTFTFHRLSYDEAETHHQITELVLQGKLKAANWYDQDAPIPLEDLGCAVEQLKSRKAVKYLIDLG
jgi:L-iditol 2-dehydrogenase